MAAPSQTPSLISEPLAGEAMSIHADADLRPRIASRARLIEGGSA
jgi:hypothetical protein